MTMGDYDRKNLLRDTYAIDGISAPECRSIFLDWALSLPQDATPTDAIRLALSLYEADHPDHPMTQTLQAGLQQAGAPKRRGGRAARVPN